MDEPGGLCAGGIKWGDNEDGESERVTMRHQLKQGHV